MLWSRITSLNGADRPIPSRNGDVLEGGRNPTAYIIKEQDIITKKMYPTLKRSVWLVFILVAYPVLTLTSAIINRVMYAVPVSEDFNVVALLAAAKDTDLQVLSGASFSGESRCRIPVRLGTQALTGEAPTVRLSLENEHGISVDVKQRTYYS